MAAQVQPQGGGFSYPALALRFYSALRGLGIQVDFVPPGADLARYTERERENENENEGERERRGRERL